MDGPKNAILILVVLLILVKKSLNSRTQVTIQDTEPPSGRRKQDVLHDDRVTLELAQQFVHEIGIESVEGFLDKPWPVLGEAGEKIRNLCDAFGISRIKVVGGKGSTPCQVVLGETIVLLKHGF